MSVKSETKKWFSKEMVGSAVVASLMIGLVSVGIKALPSNKATAMLKAANNDKV